MYVGICCVYEEIWLKMMTMGEWNDAKMDGFINNIMASWRPKNYHNSCAPNHYWKLYTSPIHAMHYIYNYG